MSDGASPVQPLESTGGATDARLANMLASAKATPAAAETTAPSADAPKAPTHLCPNCLNGRGEEVDLELDANGTNTAEHGKCPKCGYDAELRAR